MFYFAYGAYPSWIRWPMVVITAALVFFFTALSIALAVSHNAVIALLKRLPDPMEP